MKRIHPYDPKQRLVRPQLIRSVNIKIDDFPKPKLVRQTNEHECLPQELWLRWWTADTVEKNSIWMEYESTTW
jgi:hypothetical protein